MARYYFARNKYGWDEQQMSSYLFNYRLAYLASLWVVIPLLSNVARVSDNIIGIIACLTTAAGDDYFLVILLQTFCPRLHVTSTDPWRT